MNTFLKNMDADTFNKFQSYVYDAIMVSNHSTDIVDILIRDRTFDLERLLCLHDNALEEVFDIYQDFLDHYEAS